MTGMMDAGHYYRFPPPSSSSLEVPSFFQSLSHSLSGSFINPTSFLSCQSKIAFRKPYIFNLSFYELRGTSYQNFEQQQIFQTFFFFKSMQILQQKLQCCRISEFSKVISTKLPSFVGLFFMSLES